MSSPSLQTAEYVVEWVIRLGALAVVPLRREAAATRAWLLLIFFLPIPGFLLFLFIGSPRFPKWRAERFRHILPFLHDLGGKVAAAAPAREGDPIAVLARRLGYLPACAGNQVELIDDYDAMIDRLVADIDGAERWVRLLVYIFADDKRGRLVADALARARARGVTAQVLFDPVGSRQWRKGIKALLDRGGVEVREALPFHLIGRRTRRDMRNHRKLFSIDGRIGYAGSQNIVCRDFKPGVVNRELVARVTGPVVAEIEAAIRADWFLETETFPNDPVEVPPATGDAEAQLLPSGADYPLEGFHTLLIWQLHQAQGCVRMATPYFIPDEDLLGAMRTAVARGVEVDLVVSQVVDQRLVNLAQCSYYDELLRCGVRVHLFRDELLHAKNVSVDSRFAIVGSSNVDLRSFQLNEEASLLLYDRTSVEAVEAVQRGYLANSDLLDLEAWRQRPAWRKLAENVARMVSSLL